MIKGARAEPPADIYALGCVTYECIAGRPPFGDGSFVEATLASLQDEPADPCAGRADLPPTLSFAILQALAKRPSERPPTAAAYALMLRISARAAFLAPELREELRDAVCLARDLQGRCLDPAGSILQCGRGGHGLRLLVAADEVADRPPGRVATG